MSNTEIQDEEREVLQSIYDGDAQFKEVSSKIFQYKYGENESKKSFLLEIEWTENYPEELPRINLDTFYNKHVTSSVKEKIKELVIEQGTQFLGMSMTYSLFEAVKEKFEELIDDQPETVEPVSIDSLTISEDTETTQDSKKVPKKEQLTKAQKRRQWNRLDAKGEKPRGWNWTDIVKHLSQTGSKDDKPPTS